MTRQDRIYGLILAWSLLGLSYVSLLKQRMRRRARVRNLTHALHRIR